MFEREAFENFKKLLTGLVSLSVAKSSAAKFKKLGHFDDEFYRMLLELDPLKASDEELEDAIYFVFDSYQNQGITIEMDEMNIISVRGSIIIN